VEDAGLSDRQMQHCLQILVPKAEEATPKRIQVRPGPATIPAAGSEDTTPS
jgi:hypothetical protein